MRTVVSTLPTVALLIAVLGYGVSEKLHARLLSLGESTWPGYHRLREDPEPPNCEVIEARGKTSDEVDNHNGGQSDEELLDDLLDEVDSTGPAPEAMAAARAECEARKTTYQETISAITPSVRVFRSLETGLAAWTQFAVRHLSHALVLILMWTAATATWMGRHIALRQPVNRVEARTRAGGELLANGLLLVSSGALMQVEQGTLLNGDTLGLRVIWLVGLALLTCLALVRALRPSGDLPAGGRPSKGLVAIPLYAFMAIVAGGYFFVKEGHPAGLAIHLDKLSEHALLYIHVGLYVWVGMLLAQTRISALVLDMSRPWKLSAEPFALVIILLSALPTAYSGASGIFVIAAGALIYQKLREANCRQGLALATTAMSGSMGVVLSPCLLVVVVASLNKEVTTDELYAWGVGVFFLTIGLLAVVLWWTREEPWRVASLAAALPESLEQSRPLLPYIALLSTMVVVFWFGLQAKLDEHSAPILLPVIMLVLLAYDRWAGESTPPRKPLTAFFRSTSNATSEAATHIGALLLLMGLSVCLGGVIERSELMSLIPEDFGSSWMAMSLLVVVLVLIGMVMDPYGAVILVSATLAPVAYRNGIRPVHFWMVVLVAFELGYLTPPVALNHLLTRQVVGQQAPSIGAHTEARGFWARHEHVLLPVAVLGMALLLVAFGPLLVAPRL